MNKEELKRLGLIVAIEDYCKNEIEKAKEDFRKMTEEEIAKINEGIFLTIKPKDYTKTTYSEEYKTELKKLQEKYPAMKETLENYSMELNATSYSNSKAQIIINEMLDKNKTELKNMAASGVANTNK